MREQLEQHVDVLEERLKKINSRLFIDENEVAFKEAWDINKERSSVRNIFNNNTYIADQRGVSDKEWEAIPHNLVLATVKEWQEEFTEEIPNLKIGQLRKNVNGDFCLMVKYNSADDDIRVWNLNSNNYESLDGMDFTSEYGTNSKWKKHLPKVVTDDVSTLLGVVKSFQV